VLTGIRRSGKSVLLMQLKNELLHRDVKEENIIYINFESFKFSDIDTAKLLYEFIEAKITNKRKYYLLLDEIQEVKNWEKAINSFQVDFNTDI